MSCVINWCQKETLNITAPLPPNKKILELVRRIAVILSVIIPIIGLLAICCCKEQYAPRQRDIQQIPAQRARQPAQNPAPLAYGRFPRQHQNIFANDYTMPAVLDFTRVNPQNPAFKGNVAPQRLNFNDCTIALECGSIVDAQVPCIVNSTNHFLMSEGVGAEGVIHRAAGPQLQALCNALPLQGDYRCGLGQTVVTDSANLAQRGIQKIIHTVVVSFKDKWNQTREDRGVSSNARVIDDLRGALHRNYANVLNTAVETGVRSLALPVLGAGEKGFPYAYSVQVAIDVAELFLEQNPGLFDEIKIILWDGDEISAKNAAWGIHAARHMHHIDGVEFE